MAEIAGLTLITPSSVAGSGVSLSGAKVVFTAATSVSVNGVFDSTYDNYLIVHLSKVSAAAESRMRMRLSGSDATGSDYVSQYVYANGTSVTGARQTTSEFTTSAGSTDTFGGCQVYFYGPALAQPTAYRTVTAYSNNGTPAIYDFGATHSLSTAYDGFTIFPASGNISGALTVYGLSQ